MRSSTFHAWDRALDGQLEQKLRDWRDDESQLTFSEIAVRLRLDHDIHVTDETVRRWCIDLGIHEPKAAA